MFEFMQNVCYCIFCRREFKVDEMFLACESTGVCRTCYSKLNKTLPAQCYDGGKELDFLVAPFIYEGAMKESLKRYKFKNQRAYAAVIGKLIGDYINGFTDFPQFDAILPVPLHSTREHERGYNQAELIAGRISEETGIPLRNDIIFRAVATKRQSSLSKADRYANVKDAFVANKLRSEGGKFLLVDDVFTIGATMNSCALALRDAGAEIVCGAVCATNVLREKSAAIEQLSTVINKKLRLY